jgi:uncharacterized linocin/CFP29 family protein
LPLVELRAEFALSRAELRDADRGADDADWGPLDEAAHQLATSENVAVFHHWQGAVVGIAGASPHDSPSLGATPDEYPRSVAQAVEWLLQSGIGGPYAIALGSEHYRSVMETAEHGGYPLFEHLRSILDGGRIVWAPGVRGAVVLSTRGGDFLFESGQDVSIGYDSHDGDSIRLYLEESFSFHVATPEAAVALTG